MLWMCGMPGLTPGDLIDIDMDAVDGEGVIHLSNADYLTRPLRLSADEALALVLALRTLREIAGPGQAGRGGPGAGASSRRRPAVPAHRAGQVAVTAAPRRHPGPGQRRAAARQAARPDLRRGDPGRDDPAAGRPAAGLRARGVRLPRGLVLLAPRRCAPSGWTGSPPSRSPMSTSSRHDVVCTTCPPAGSRRCRTPRW